MQVIIIAVAVVALAALLAAIHPFTFPIVVLSSITHISAMISSASYFLPVSDIFSGVAILISVYNYSIIWRVFVFIASKLPYVGGKSS